MSQPGAVGICGHNLVDLLVLGDYKKVSNPLACSHGTNSHFTFDWAGQVGANIEGNKSQVLLVLQVSGIFLLCAHETIVHYLFGDISCPRPEAAPRVRVCTLERLCAVL